MVFSDLSRSNAKACLKTIRSGLSHAVMPIKCTGILAIDGGTRLKVQVWETTGSTRVAGSVSFSVYEGTNKEK
jgi:hypothetical protein